MKFYEWERERLVRRNDLWQALRLSPHKHQVIALTGAGGKTSVMFRLADEMANSGRGVIVTTTTHILRPDNRAVLETAEAGAAGRRLRELMEAGRENLLVVGLLAEDGKLKAMPPEETAALRRYADVLFIEADGAKKLPIKAPREGEPVIPDYANVVIGCLGLDSIGEELDGICFRKELAGRLLGLEPEPDGNYHHRITPLDAAVILTSREGTRKSVGDKPFRVVLNKADGEDRLFKAKETIREINRLRPELCAVTSFLED